MAQTGYQELINKIEVFIRKYYKNLLLKGGVYFILMALLAFLLIVLLEHFGWYSTTARAILFYTYCLVNVVGLYVFVVTPLLGMYKLGKTLTIEQASQLIGQYFPEVGDVLLNTLQLGKNRSNAEANQLLEAAIQQKANQLSPIPFTDAVDLRKNKRKAWLVIVPLSIYGILYLFVPGMLTSASQRIVNYNQVFVPPAPFNFLIENDQLVVPQFADFELKVAVEGSTIPAEVMVVYGESEYRMQKIDKTHFSYVFRNLNTSVPFFVKAASYNSAAYELKVVSKPTLVNYQVKLTYPSYTGKPAEVITNPGDLAVPYGTQASWQFTTTQTDTLLLGFGNVAVPAVPVSGVQFTHQKKLLHSTPYFIKTQNAAYGVADSLSYYIQVVADEYPSLTVDAKSDSLTGKQLFFIGDAADDYGLTKLVFAYRFIKSDDEAKVKLGKQARMIGLSTSGKSQRFYYEFNLNEIGVSAADEVEYYFEVWDNDGVRGAKSSKSKAWMYKAPTLRQLQNELDQAGKSLKSDMQEAIKESRQLQKELKSLQQKMLDKRELTWEEKKKAEEILKRQRELMEKMKDIKDQQEKNNLREQEFKAPDPELLEKQKLLEKMAEELLNDDLKKLMKEMEKLLQQQNKDAVKQEMEKLQTNNKDVEKELERMLEQFKQLEVEKKLNEQISQLEKLANQEKELAQQMEQLDQNKSLTKAEKNELMQKLEQQQQQVKQDFDALKNELRDIEKKNATLETPNELSDTKPNEQAIDKSLQQASESLSKNNQKQAREKQEDAAKEMEEMASKMREKQAENEKEQHEEDAAALREILENTLQLSKDQEALINQMRTLNGYSPQYVDLAKKQKITADNAKIIEDSLLALSKRVPEISSFINKEVTKLNNNLEKSISAFGLRNFMDIANSQQYAMTHANNLAVMLSQVLNQMQQQNQQAKSKKGKQGKGKPKPGQGSGNKPLTMSQLKKMQEELNKQLREGMNKQGEQGKPNEQGGQKPGGQKPGGQQGGMGSEGFARMAAQQMAIRQQMQKMLQQMDAKQKEGIGGGKMLEEMRRMMEQTEKELFNKRLTAEMLQRQQDILTRMLESEKAERKQEQEQKREAEQAKSKPKVSPPDFNLYIEQKNREKELLETVPANMLPYYRQKSTLYFNKLGTGN